MRMLKMMVVPLVIASVISGNVPFLVFYLCVTKACNWHK